ATLSTLIQQKDQLYIELYRLGDKLRDGLRQRLDRAGIPSLVGGLGPVVQVSLTDQKALYDYRDWAQRDDSTYRKIVRELSLQSIRTIPRGTWYLSAAHTDEDVEETVDTFEAVLHLL